MDPSPKPGAPRPPPAAGLIAFDAFFWLVFAIVFAGAAIPTAWLWSLAPLAAPWSLVLVIPLVFVFLLLLLLEIALLRRLAPRLRPGRYRFPNSSMARAWLWTLQLQRIAFQPLWAQLITGSASLRYLALRALGAKLAFRSMMSSDAVHLDPGMLDIGAGTLLGGTSLTAGHLITGNHLILGTVRVEPGAEVHADGRIGPGTRLGAGAQLGLNSIAPFQNDIGEDARIGVNCSLAARARIGRNARIGDGCVIGRGARIGAGATVAAGSIVPDGAVIPDGARFPADPTGDTEAAITGTG
jgi:acetyltransferase-like isoleucine patch superfamily enzyme